MKGLEGGGDKIRNDALVRPLSDVEFRSYRKFFEERIGLHLTSHKKQMLSGRLCKRVGALGLRTFSAYLDLIAGGENNDELQVATDLITTHETFFFREARHFDVVRDAVLPLHPGDKPLRVWSAACSTGEEPYSLAMVLHGALGPVGWEVVATDVSRGTLEKASTGLYRMDRLDGMPQHFLKAYCLKGKDEYEGWMLVSRTIRGSVSFRQVNLMDIPGSLGLFDVVFLRNVIIYFDAETKRKVIEGVISHMAPGGWLFLGHSESVTGGDLPLALHAPTIYRRLP